jgi:DNA anti-recombination protein RmuC
MPVSPELREGFAEQVKKITTPTSDQYRVLEDRVTIQQNEILKLRREIGRLKNQITEMQRRTLRG